MGCEIVNPTIKRLTQEILSTPELKFQNNSSKGFISAVYYKRRKCDVVYWAPDGAQKTAKNINLPKDGDGIFRESLKPGDVVELSFKGKTQRNMFISGVQKRNKSENDFEAKKGQKVPLSTNLF